MADALTRRPRRDQVDDILDQWRRQRPDLDYGPVEVVLRIQRAARHLDQAIESTLRGLGLTPGGFAVLSALRRAGPPHELRPADLLTDTLSTSPAMTNRLDRLEEAGLVRRVPDPSDRRAVLVGLTDEGLALVDRAVEAHVANEAGLVAALPAEDREALAILLRRFLAPFEPSRPDGG